MKITIGEVLRATDSVTWEHFCDKHGFSYYADTDIEVEITTDEFSEIVGGTL